RTRARLDLRSGGTGSRAGDRADAVDPAQQCVPTACSDHTVPRRVDHATAHRPGVLAVAHEEPLVSRRPEFGFGELCTQGAGLRALPRAAGGDRRAGRVAGPALGEAQEAWELAVGVWRPGRASSGPRIAPLHAVTAIAIVACGRAWEGRRKGGRGLRQ